MEWLCIYGFHSNKTFKGENMMWRDFKDEEDLICVTFKELIHNEPFFVDKDEVKHILKENDIKRIIKNADNVYKVKTSNEILYFICPIKARKEVKKWWNELIQYFDKIKKEVNNHENN